jgi:cytoskeletal protein CcmA (bactofilin family)
MMIKINRAGFKLAWVYGFVLALALWPVLGQTASSSSSAANVRYAWGRELTIDDATSGDLLVAGGNVVIRGEIQGDLLVAGGNVRLESHVVGNVRALAGNLELTSTVGRNVTVAGGTVTMTPTAHILGHLSAAAGSLQLRGTIDEGMRAAAGQVVLAGWLNGPAELWLERQATLTIEDKAVISGQLVYHTSQEASLSPAAKVSQTPVWQPLKVSQRHVYGRGWWLGQLGSLFGALVLGMIITHLWPSKLQEFSSTGLRKFWSNFGWGLIWAVGAPLVSFILLITIVGIPIAIIILALYIISLITAQVLAGAIISQIITSWPKFKIYHRLPLMLRVGLGIVVFRLLGWLPGVGGLVLIIGGLISWGAFINMARRQLI